MGIAIPQLAPASFRTSGAQVIDGSLRFDEVKNTYFLYTLVLMVTVELGLGQVG